MARPHWSMDTFKKVGVSNDGTAIYGYCTYCHADMLVISIPVTDQQAEERDVDSQKERFIIGIFEDANERLERLLDSKHSVSHYGTHGMAKMLGLAWQRANRRGT